jgi:hypothetical protein
VRYSAKTGRVCIYTKSQVLQHNNIESNAPSSSSPPEIPLACASRPIHMTTLSVCNTQMLSDPMNHNRLEDGALLGRAAEIVHAWADSRIPQRR